MARYTVLRLLVFFGCLALLWLLGLRDQEEQPWLVVGAALLSMVVSFVVLRPFREDAIRSIEERRAARAEAKGERPAPRQDSDEAAEDSATDETYR